MSLEAQEAPLIGPTYAEKIQGLRLQKEIEFLKSLNRNYRLVDRNQVVVEGILHDTLDLHVHIPQEYPFREPLYSVSSHPEDLHPVSEAIQEWVPKLKILEVVQLLALRINEKHQIALKTEKYILLKPFLEGKALPLIIMLAVVLRILLGLGSYSGKRDYPNLGDFQAHRNWMSITVNRPIQAWYEESETQPWWRIDYPPVAAYLSYIFGMIYRNIEPAAMNIQRGYQSQSLKAFMRFSALAVDLLFLIPPLVLLSKEVNKRISSLLVLVVLLKPDAILIDHGHFQYNSLILGLILLSFYCILKGKYYVACLLYTVAVHSKQMATYYSLAFLAALLGLAFRQHKRSIKLAVELAKYGLIVIVVSLVIWAPWLNSLESLSSVVSAIFPVHRGLYQLKVPNFWCISDIVFKWESLFSKTTLLVLCFVFSVLTSIPSMLSIFLNPSRKALIVGFSTISLSFFMFSYHVHEKSILLPLLMIGFAGEVVGGWLAHDVIVAGCVGMFHLLKEDQQQLGYFALMTIFYLFNSSYVSLKQELPQSYQEEEQVLKWHKKIYSSKLLRVLIFGVLVTLHLNEKLITPPASLPYLHHLLFAFFSFCFNCYFLLLGNLLQLEWVLQWMRDRSKKRL